MIVITTKSQTHIGPHQCILSFSPVFSGWSSKTSSTQGWVSSLFPSPLKASWRGVLMSDKPRPDCLLPSTVFFLPLGIRCGIKIVCCDLGVVIYSLWMAQSVYAVFVKFHEKKTNLSHIHLFSPNSRFKSRTFLQWDNS